MNYFVILPDGQQFGPATVDQLTQWASENRINRDTILRDASTGAQLRASDVPGIIWTTPTVQAAPPPPFAGGVGYGAQMGAGYGQQMPNYSAPPGYYPGSQDEGWAVNQIRDSNIVLLVLMCLCCNLPMTIFCFAVMLMTRNQQVKDRARGLLIFCVVLWVLGVVANIIFR